MTIFFIYPCLLRYNILWYNNTNHFTNRVICIITYTQMAQFVSVIRNKSISKAAEELFVAQPAISATIKKIEKELNIDLFTYENKQLHLTKEGEEAYKIIAEILNLYQKLDGLSTNTIPSRAIKKTFSYYASPSVHDFITTELQLFEVFPHMRFSLYTCKSLDKFFEATAEEENAFGIFFIPDTVALPKAPDFTVEAITSVQTTLITSNKNTSAITKKTSITLNELAKLPLICFVGSDLSIQNYLPNSNLTFCIDVDNAIQINKILNQRPELYSLSIGLNLHQTSKKCIAIPVEDAPHVNLTLIYKNNEHNTEIFSRISLMLRSLYAI